ncbi:MAG TPA: alpha/beta hydrolase [Sphingobium sp.]
MPFFIRLLFTVLAAASIPFILERPARAADTSAAREAIESFPRFTVETIGTKGPDVILIPGLATPREVWWPLAQALKGEARLHLVELRGFAPGDPGPNAQGGVIVGLVDGLAAYIADHKLKHAKVIGHSLGGLAALKLAERKPAGLDGVMIVDAMPFIGTLFAGPTATVAMIEPQAVALRDQLLGLAKSGGAMPPATNNALTEAGKAKIVEWTRAVDLSVVAWALHEDMVTDARPGLAALAVPLTLLYPVSGSEADQARTRALYTGAYADVRGARLVGIERSAHFIMLDQPALFEKEVRVFLLSGR